MNSLKQLKTISFRCLNGGSNGFDGIAEMDRIPLNLPLFIPIANLNYLKQKADKKLFTPGPLSTSRTVKEAMLRDLGSRDTEFINVIKYIQNKILDLAGLSASDKYAVVLMQGSGTFGVESVIHTVSNRQRTRFLILENGAYGQRMAKMCKLLGVEHQAVSFPEDRTIDLNRVEDILKNSAQHGFTNVGVVHSETTSDALNQVEQIGRLVKSYLPNSTFVVDAVSSFGAIPLNIQNGQIDFTITSSNKCIQAVPGFSIVISQKDKLNSCKNNSTSLSLDLYDQHETMLSTNQFRFTPPTHSMLAFKKALEELDQEGGSSARYKRYCENHRIIRESLIQLGFKELVPLDEQSKIINTFFYPKDENFKFEEFYKRLSNKGMIIYPGKITKASCFRIGNIGDLYPNDMIELTTFIKQVLNDMNVKLPVQC